MSSLPPLETPNPPTVLSDWTPKPQNFGIKIQFVLTWARGVYAFIVSFLLEERDAITGRADGLDPERNHPNAPQQRAGKYQTGYGVMVME